MTQFRGVSIDKDPNFTNKVKKLKTQLKFSRVYKKKIDFSKIQLEVIMEWSKERIVELMGFEDEIVVNYVNSMLELQDKLDPKEMQIYLTGFMEDKARRFVKELWLMLNEAQKSEMGIPKSLIEKEKKKIIEENIIKDKIGKKIREKIPNKDSVLRKRKRESRWGYTDDENPRKHQKK